MSRKISNNEILERFRETHGDRYDYSKVEYKRMHDKVCIICSKHGEFHMDAHSHINGQGCPKCGIESRALKKMDNTESFIKKAKSVHGEKYDYSKVQYIDSQTKVCIVCKEHGEFWQKPYSHIQGQGCPKCNEERLKNHSCDTLKEFIEKAKTVHGEEYDYSKVEYVDTQTKVCIICPKHGEFLQTPNIHLQGSGCPRCGVEKSHIIMSTEEYVKKAISVHGDRYDYSKVEYCSPYDYVTIVCPRHGDFKQKASYHLSGNGCPKCGIEKVIDDLSLTKEEFICKANEVHGNRYDYSKVDYLGNKQKITVICRKHGEFEVRPDNHIYNKSGCPKCSTSKLEEELHRFLAKNNILFETHKRFDWLRNDLTDYLMEYDVFIPSMNIAIECQGKQHFEFGGIVTEESHKSILHRDLVKNELSGKNGITLFYYIPKFLFGKSNDIEIYNDSNTFYDLNELLKKISNENS